MPIILGIDSSLTGTGLVRLCVSGPDETQQCIDNGYEIRNEPPYPYWPAIATVKAPKAKTGDTSALTTSRRIEHIIDAIGAAIIDGGSEQLFRPDLIALEGIPYGAKGEAQSKLNWLWGRIVDLVRGHGIPLLCVHNTAVKTFATGKGNAPKDEVLLAMAQRVGGEGFIPGTSTPKPKLANNNEADALAVAMIGARFLGCPVDSMPQKHLKAFDNGKVTLQ